MVDNYNLLKTSIHKELKLKITDIASFLNCLNKNLMLLIFNRPFPVKSNPDWFILSASGSI